jgi:hypothetical protein
MILTEKQMINIIKKNLINSCNEHEKRQVYEFAFGLENFIYIQTKATILGIGN